MSAQLTRAIKYFPIWNEDIEDVLKIRDETVQIILDEITMGRYEDMKHYQTNKIWK